MLSRRIRRHSAPTRLPMEHSSIEHAATASATRSNETDEETLQPGQFLRKLLSSKASPLSSHQTQKVQEKSTYYHRISPSEICRILRISMEKPGIDSSVYIYM